MSVRVVCLPVLALGLALIASACTVSSTPGGAEVTVVCAGEGDSCDTDADCCSDACGSDNTCSGADNCVLDNDACGNDSDCCSMICAGDGYCGVP